MSSLVLAVFAIGASPPAAAAGRLNLYCAYPDAALCGAIAQGFARAHDVQVSVVQKPTGELLAQIVAEARNPRGDVWWAGTGDVFLQAAEKGVLDVYRSPRLPELHDWAVREAQASGYRAVGIYGAVLVLAYNHELLRKKHLSAPQCWKDLLRPEYRGEIEVSNPSSSGTAYLTLATWVQLFGEDAAFRFVRNLNGSISSYARSGAGPLKAVARGEATVGVAVQHGVVNEQANGFPVDMSWPCEGTGQEIGSMAIIRNARHLENARLFYDWALSREAQELPFAVGQYPLPANKTARPPAGLQVPPSARRIAYDYARFGASAERKRLLARWNAAVNDAP
ncbi:MAG: ABC transporter substrate-binding protein [Sulfurifustis sp.]